MLYRVNRSRAPGGGRHLLRRVDLHTQDFSSRDCSERGHRSCFDSNTTSAEAEHAAPPQTQPRGRIIVCPVVVVVVASRPVPTTPGEETAGTAGRGGRAWYFEAQGVYPADEAAAGEGACRVLSVRIRRPLLCVRLAVPLCGHVHRRLDGAGGYRGQTLTAGQPPTRPAHRHTTSSHVARGRSGKGGAAERREEERRQVPHGQVLR